MPEIETLERLREICLELPEAFEEFTWDSETFRVRKKIFAMHSGGDTQSQVWLKGRPGDQEMLIAAEPARFFRPPYLRIQRLDQDLAQRPDRLGGSRRSRRNQFSPRRAETPGGHARSGGVIRRKAVERPQ
ncbi:MAG: MmcQ/YjbR family DNA-binding protein [Thermomicrobiales bacterium]